MARVVPLRGGDSDSGDGGDKTTARKTIGERDFQTLVKKCKSSTATMAAERGSLGGLIADAVEHKYLHKGAFGIFRRLDAMNAYKRAELLFHLDVYRERAKWDTTDMFEDRSGEASAAE
jgi:hypothetical protein